MSKGGITIGGLHSYNDLGLRLLSRQIGAPEEKSAIVDDIVFRDGFTDYTTSWHRKFYGTRSAVYTFRYLGKHNTETIHAVLEWLADVMDSDIYDDFEAGWHLRGSLAAEPTITEDASRAFTDIEVEFVCQPYWYADAEITLQASEGASVLSNTGRATTVTAAPVEEGTTLSVQLGGTAQEISEPTVLLEEAAPGDNLLVVEGGEVILTWHQTRL